MFEAIYPGGGASREEGAAHMNPRDRIDPELKGALDVALSGKDKLLDLSDIVATRGAVHAMAEEMLASDQGDTGAVVETSMLPRPSDPGVAIRIIRPADGSEPLPALVWFHGGGQVLGFAAQEDPFLKRLAAAVRCVVCQTARNRDPLSAPNRDPVSGRFVPVSHRRDPRAAGCPSRG